MECWHNSARDDVIRITLSQAVWTRVFPLVIIGAYELSLPSYFG